MSSSMQFYVSLLLVYAGVDVIACLGLNLQFGVAGLLSFAFIVFQAAGAYTAAVLTLGPSSALGGFQHYILGLTLPFPLPMLAATAVGGLMAVPIGIVALRRLRSDYQAVALLVLSIIATGVATNEVWLFNGSAGLALVPHPLADTLGLDPLAYQWLYAGLTALLCLIVFFVVRRLTNSPLGRAWRAMRDNDYAAASIGKGVVGLRMRAFVIGGAIAGLSGAVLVEFIGTWAPSAWLYPETFVFLSAIIIGGTGNNVGVIAGVLLVPVGFLEASRFLPEFGHPGLSEALQWVLVGALLLFFLWFRPQGLIPESRRRFPSRGSGEVSRITEPVTPSTSE